MGFNIISAAEAVPDMRVRFTTSHPKDMSDETLQVIAETPNVCKHIHLPVQSGSSRILKQSLHYQQHSSGIRRFQ